MDSSSLTRSILLVLTEAILLVLTEAILLVLTEAILLVLTEGGVSRSPSQSYENAADD